MIEIVYNKEKENAVGNEEYFCIPRNIRQIGDVPKENKIYVEDYVYTYLTADWKAEDADGKIAVLLGKYNWKNGVSYVFVKSAVIVEDIPVFRDNYPLTYEVWGHVYEEMKTYFSGQEVVGWYLSFQDSGMHITDTIIQTHLKHFGGNDKVLLLADPYEKECVFYLYKNNRMEQQQGYYIFYEKNELMQEYMMAKNPDAEIDYSGKIEDKAVKDFRKIAAKKLEEKNEKKSSLSWIQVACAGVIVVSLTASSIWLRNQNKAESQSLPVNSEETSSVVNEYDFENAAKENQEMVLLTPEVTEITKTPSEDAGEQDETGGIEEQSQTAENPEAEETAISVYTQYTVRAGDTLSQISMRYYGDFSKVTEICKINNLLEEDVIYPGQTILLP